MTALREKLRGKLTKKELSSLRASFDVVGDIALIEIPFELKKKEKLVGNALLSLLKNVKVVAVKSSPHRGIYRRQKLKVIAGEKRLITVHKESGILLRLDVEKCYFSPRLVTERLRIARLVKNGERVLVAGSGVAPYPIVIAKHSPVREIIGVELNPVAHKYACENVLLNKLSNKVKLVKGDIRKVRLGLFDRIIVAIPHNGIKLVPSILKFAKKGAFLHVYDFASEENLSDAGARLRSACSLKKKSCKVLRIVRAGQHAVRKYRVCVDARL
ncbi:MAG TPA: class I SAM-dependent methyltransferase family protein [Candidatus Nanoarchaeia archaeon]|nr:class I SAM-dependent methyltransferase family protein [Candidatus Nanoarchaeia archaeon]